MRLVASLIIALSLVACQNIRTYSGPNQQNWEPDVLKLKVSMCGTTGC